MTATASNTTADNTTASGASTTPAAGAAVAGRTPLGERAPAPGDSVSPDPVADVRASVDDLLSLAPGGASHG